MGGAIGEILPLALAVTISPVPIIAEILLLFTDKPKANAGAYLLGFIVGVGAVLVILLSIAGTQDLGDADSTASTSSSWIRIALGALLVMAAVRKFRGRPAPGDDVAMPSWMTGIAGFAPPKSIGIGVLIGALNPKNLAVGIAAALAISSAGLSTTDETITVIAYVVIASLGVAAPFVVAVAMGDRSTAVLDSWKTWLGQNNTTVMSVLLLVFGVVIIGKGITGLSA